MLYWQYILRVLARLTGLTTGHSVVRPHLSVTEVQPVLFFYLLVHVLNIPVAINYKLLTCAFNNPFNAW